MKNGKRIAAILGIIILLAAAAMPMVVTISAAASSRLIIFFPICISTFLIQNCLQIRQARPDGPNAPFT